MVSVHASPALFVVGLFCCGLRDKRGRPQSDSDTFGIVGAVGCKLCTMRQTLPHHPCRLRTLHLRCMSVVVFLCHARTRRARPGLRPAAQRRHQMLQELVRERVLRGVWRRYVGILKARLVSLAALPWSISARPCIVPAGLATFRSVGKAYWATLALTCRRSPQLLARRSKRAAAPARPEPQVPCFTLRERNLSHARLAATEEVMSVKSIREQDGKAFCGTGTNALQHMQRGQRQEQCCSR